MQSIDQAMSNLKSKLEAKATPSLSQNPKHINCSNDFFVWESIADYMGTYSNSQTMRVQVLYLASNNKTRLEQWGNWLSNAYLLESWEMRSPKRLKGYSYEIKGKFRQELTEDIDHVLGLLAGYYHPTTNIRDYLEQEAEFPIPPWFSIKSNNNGVNQLSPSFNLGNNPATIQENLSLLFLSEQLIEGEVIISIKFPNGVIAELVAVINQRNSDLSVLAIKAFVNYFKKISSGEKLFFPVSYSAGQINDAFAIIQGQCF